MQDKESNMEYLDIAKEYFGLGIITTLFLVGIGIAAGFMAAVEHNERRKNNDN